MKRPRVMNIRETIAIGVAIWHARHIQEFLWGETDGAWGLLGWQKMLEKRLQKISAIRREQPHAVVELKKRLLQCASLCIAFIATLEKYGMPDDGDASQVKW